MSGFQAALARIGAIERMVSGVRAPMPPAAAAATSFAETLSQAAAVASDGPTPAALMGAVPVAAGASAVPTPPAPASDAPLALPVASLAGPSAATALALASPVAETRPSAPAVDAAYRPAHVTETDERVWNDCTWASAVMWIDKLTGGSMIVDREKLRAASGDLHGGSSLGDVVRGARKLLGLDLRDAHTEGLTMAGLLDRLAAGGGAIVQGSYASLPAHLTRHDPGFAAKGVAASGHAVYVGPLDLATGKVWWDDPLAPAGASGEWISVKALKRFAWTDSSGRVSAMATPAGTGAGAAPDREAASISAAAWTAGVDPLLLTAYLRVARIPVEGGTIDDTAGELAAALVRYGRADLALESLGADRRSGGSAFAVRVLRQWAGLLEGATGG